MFKKHINSNNLCILPNHSIKNINFMSIFLLSFHFISFIINVNLMWVFVFVFDLFSGFQKGKLYQN